jgi:hypothetical protein
MKLTNIAVRTVCGTTALGLLLLSPRGDLRAAPVQLLADPGFENPSPLGTDPWRVVYFTTAPAATNATTMPASGVEHASVTKDHALPFVETQIASAVFAGFGPAATITDFRGKSLDLSVDYKVNANTIASGGTPGTYIRMFVTFFGTSGFLGFGSFTSSDVFEAGANASYQTLAFSDVVPAFASPVTSVDLNIAVLGQGGGTGSATVFFDNASLITDIVPEPTSATLASLGLAWLVRRSLRSRGTSRGVC